LILLFSQLSKRRAKVRTIPFLAGNVVLSAAGSDGRFGPCVGKFEAEFERVVKALRAE